jgi:hypothetical protein
MSMVLLLMRSLNAPVRGLPSLETSNAEVISIICQFTSSSVNGPDMISTKFTKRFVDTLFTKISDLINHSFS